MGSVLNSAEWGDVPLALRERAFFSAEVEKLRLLQRMQDRVQTAIGMLRRPGEGADGGDGAFQTREKFIAEMRQLAREEGLDPRSAPTRENVFAGRPEALGTMKDITSERRLKLIYDVQTESAAEYARWKAEQDPAVLAAYPAQEFARIKAVKKPRLDWRDRWLKAGGKIIQGRMVALKNDPVWRRLSRFGTPYPPFDFGSGMGLRDLSRRDAEALGLIAPGNPPPTGAEEDFNQELQASVADLNPEYRRLLGETFKDQIEFENDSARWIPEPDRVQTAKLKLEDLAAEAGEIADEAARYEAAEEAAGRDPGDATLRALARRQGFDAPPQVLNPAALDEAVAAGDTELFRGIADAGAQTAETFAEQLRAGNFHAGRGMFGNGTYAAAGYGDAADFSAGQGVVVRMALKQRARLVDSATLLAAFARDRAALPPLLAQDLGRYATARGIDAMQVTGTGDYVIFNRSALRIQDRNLTDR